MNEQEVIELLKNRLSIEFFEKMTYDGKELRVELKLDNKLISYDSVNIETLIK